MKFFSLLVLTPQIPTSVTAAEKPNVIILITGDQGYPELSAHGNPVLQTPHLDALHAERTR